MSKNDLQIPQITNEPMAPRGKTHKSIATCDFLGGAGGSDIFKFKLMFKQHVNFPISFI